MKKQLEGKASPKPHQGKYIQALREMPLDGVTRSSGETPATTTQNSGELDLATEEKERTTGRSEWNTNPTCATPNAAMEACTAARNVGADGNDRADETPGALAQTHERSIGQSQLAQTSRLRSSSVFVRASASKTYATPQKRGSSGNTTSHTRITCDLRDAEQTNEREQERERAPDVATPKLVRRDSEKQRVRERRPIRGVQTVVPVRQQRASVY